MNTYKATLYYSSGRTTSAIVDAMTADDARKQLLSIPGWECCTVERIDK